MPKQEIKRDKDGKPIPATEAEDNLREILKSSGLIFPASENVSEAWYERSGEGVFTLTFKKDRQGRIYEYSPIDWEFVKNFCVEDHPWHVYGSYLAPAHGKRQSKIITKVKYR